MGPLSKVTQAKAAIPHLVLLAWLVVVGVALAFHHTLVAAPPVGDALSYIAKAKAFWEAIQQGHIVDPFNVPSSFRPPGTILMSYPFGFTPDFRWFYFRAAFLPVVFLVGAVYAAAPSIKTHPWLTLACALILSGMPILYQFEFNDDLRSLAAWGLVDNLHAGVAALAMASTLRAVRLQSHGWTLAAVLLAAFCVFIKPAGGLVMIVIALTWLMLIGQGCGWNVRRLRETPAALRFTAFGLAAGVIVYALVTWAAFQSQYLSAANIAYGRQAIAILRENDIRSTFDYSGDFLRLSLGYPVVLTIIIGLMAALYNRQHRIFAAIACLSAVMGGALLILQADITQMRYAVVFAAMTFVALLPAMIDAAARAQRAVVLSLGGLLVLPTLGIAILVAMPAPPLLAQAALGINLLSNSYQAEGAEAVSWLEALKTEGVKATSLYVLGFEWSTFAFWGMVEYQNLADPSWPRVQPITSVDWLRSSAVRTADILASDYIVFQPVTDTAARDILLNARDVPDFITEQRLARAWLSTLGETDGLKVMSETRTRIVKIVDCQRLEASLAQLDAAHTWPPKRPSSLKSWWTAEEIASFKPQLSPDVADIGFHIPTQTDATYIVRAASVTPDLEGLKVQFWIETGPGPSAAGQEVFVHLLNEAGEIVGNAQLPLLDLPPPSATRAARLYTAFFPAPPKTAASIAFGLFRPAGQSAEFLIADHGKGDWEGRRIFMPLPLR